MSLKTKEGFLPPHFSSLACSDTTPCCRAEATKRRKEQKRQFKLGLSSSIIPDEIMNVIWEENRAFLSEKYTHDSDFLKVATIPSFLSPRLEEANISHLSFLPFSPVCVGCHAPVH